MAKSSTTWVMGLYGAWQSGWLESESRPLRTELAAGKRGPGRWLLPALAAALLSAAGLGWWLSGEPPHAAIDSEERGLEGDLIAQH